MLQSCSRGERIRTSGLSVPNRALYQTEPRPEYRSFNQQELPQSNLIVGEARGAGQFGVVVLCVARVVARASASADSYPLFNKDATWALSGELTKDRRHRSTHLKPSPTSGLLTERHKRAHINDELNRSVSVDTCRSFKVLAHLLRSVFWIRFARARNRVLASELRVKKQ